MPPLPAAIANAGRPGVLAKSAVVREQLDTATRLTFDKTGTLSHGTPSSSGSGRWTRESPPTHGFDGPPLVATKRRITMATTTAPRATDHRSTPPGANSPSTKARPLLVCPYQSDRREEDEQRKEQP